MQSWSYINKQKQIANESNIHLKPNNLETNIFRSPLGLQQLEKTYTRWQALKYSEVRSFKQFKRETNGIIYKQTNMRYSKKCQPLNNMLQTWVRHILKVARSI